MDVRPDLESARRLALSRMLDTLEVSRPAGAPVYAPVTRRNTPAASTRVYRGPGRVAATVSVGASSTAGEAELLVQRWTVHLPFDGTADLRGGDTITVAASTTSPDLVGRSFVVTSRPASSQATALRVPVAQAA